MSMFECFKAADCAEVKAQRPSEPAMSSKPIGRLMGSYTQPVVPAKRNLEMLGRPWEKEAEAAPERPTRVLPLRRSAPSSPPPSRICEDDERRILLKMEQLLKNEAKIVEVEEENRVLTRMVMRLQAENDALKAK